MTVAPPAPQELGAVGGQTVGFLAGGQEGHPLAELFVVGVTGQQCEASSVKLWNDVLLGCVPGCAQHPLGVESNGDMPVTVPRVLQPQLHHLHRRVRDGEKAQPVFEAVAMMLED